MLHITTGCFRISGCFTAASQWSGHPPLSAPGADDGDSGKGEDSPLTQRRVLIVEDEALIAWTLSTMIEDLGMAVAGMAATADDAVAQAETLKPDLVLMDIRLKGEKSGITACRLIRAKSDIPVIFVTGHGDPTSVRLAEETNPVAIVLKPVREQDLKAAIMKVYGSTDDGH
jgi:two-component system, response regulator PdtaR